MKVQPGKRVQNMITGLLELKTELESNLSIVVAIESAVLELNNVEQAINEEINQRRLKVK